MYTVYIYIYTYQRLNHDSEIQIRKKPAHVYISVSPSPEKWGISPTKRHQPLRRIWRKALGRRGFLIRRDWPSSQVSSMGCPQCISMSDGKQLLSGNRTWSLKIPQQILFIDFPVKNLHWWISHPRLSGGYIYPGSVTRRQGSSSAQQQAQHHKLCCFSNSSRSELNWAFGGNGWKWWICPMKPWGKWWLTGGFWGILSSDKP